MATFWPAGTHHPAGTGSARTPLVDGREPLGAGRSARARADHSPDFASDQAITSTHARTAWPSPTAVRRGADPYRCRRYYVSIPSMLTA